MITRKTEIGPLDSTPEKRLFWSIINDYDLQTALTELIDNALDIWIANPKQQMQVNLELDVERQLITLQDNAGGVRREDLRLLVTPGGSKNSPDSASIGIFGVGSKRAVVAIAEYIVIKTHHAGDRSYQIDITRDWLVSSEWELPAYEIPEIDEGKTRIELSQLRRSFNDEDVQELIDHIGDTYELFLRDGNCQIIVNGQNIMPHGFDTWAYPPDQEPRLSRFKVKPSGNNELGVEITAGLIRDRDPKGDNYGTYFYCNNRLILKHHKSREVGYFVSTEAGVPHPDISLCRAIVKLNGPAKLMPWNSSKTGLNFSHPAFQQLRPTLIQLVSYYSKLSRRTNDDWDEKVFRHSSGEVEEIEPADPIKGKKLVLPELPRVNKIQADHLKAKNAVTIKNNPWTLGLIEALSAVDILSRQRLQTRNRIALLLLDSNFEIALKEFIVHRQDLFDPYTYNDAKLKELFERRHKVIDEVVKKVPSITSLLALARHYYSVRNKLVHERATVEVTEYDVENYRETVEKLLTELFGLDF